MWPPLGDQRGQHWLPWVPNPVIRRSLVPFAEAVKTVSSPNFPPARVNRIFPFSEVSATVGDDEADADARLGEPVPAEDEPAPLAPRRDQGDSQRGHRQQRAAPSPGANFCAHSPNPRVSHVVASFCQVNLSCGFICGPSLSTARRSSCLPRQEEPLDHCSDYRRCQPRANRLSQKWFATRGGRPTESQRPLPLREHASTSRQHRDHVPRDDDFRGPRKVPRRRSEISRGIPGRLGAQTERKATEESRRGFEGRRPEWRLPATTLTRAL